ncbi:hypothetical protein [Paenibacillus sp. MMS18-CY102]|uniref:hypothetical protein n=1 Tax=Paenibacillus sp. MMS18-CY102 TaxID=2682849 RepID=UPI001365B7EB|nr:hypothetical protein [Paenibacillus sp. MMS18-CY102]MWC29005.1 hypothetical protein [Paenibacillus sp. MMS18-CY102]
MAKNDQIENNNVCPWCHSEIVWDEEIGPEEHCPHCSNELSGYRTLQVGIDQEDSEQAYDDEVAGQHQQQAEEEDDWASEDNKKQALSGDGYRHAGRVNFAIEESVQRVLDDQLEMPECPSCRNYMIELGVHNVSRDYFNPAVPLAIGKPLLEPPFETVMFVCPACFETSTKLTLETRKRLTDLLKEEADKQ